MHFSQIWLVYPDSNHKLNIFSRIYVNKIGHFANQSTKWSYYTISILFPAPNNFMIFNFCSVLSMINSSAYLSSQIWKFYITGKMNSVKLEESIDSQGEYYNYKILFSCHLLPFFRALKIANDQSSTNRGMAFQILSPTSSYECY